MNSNQNITYNIYYVNFVAFNQGSTLALFLVGFGPLNALFSIFGGPKYNF